MSAMKHPVTEGLQLTEGEPTWGRWFRLVEAEKTRGDEVMTGAEGKPLLILDREEKGRIALLLSDQAWLWSRGFEGGGPQLELLRRLAHWTMQEPDLEEERISAETNGPDVIVTRRSVTDEQRELYVENPDGSLSSVEMTQVSPGKWTGKFKGEENGLYRLIDGDQTAVVALGPTLPREFEQVIATDELMAGLIDGSGGGVIELDAVPNPDIRITRVGRVSVGAEWVGLHDRQAYVATSVRQMPLIPVWLYMLMAAALAVLAWWVEGRRTK